MPWHTEKSEACPVDRPWAVIKDADGEVEGCHATEAGAQDQVAALYAAESTGAHDEDDDNGSEMSKLNRTAQFPEPGSVERRDAMSSWPAAELEIRSDGNGMTFRGYAAIFNSRSEDLGGFRETIMPGAFSRSLNAAANGSRDIRMFLNHNADIVLGSTRAKTLRLTQDQRGLLAESDLPNSPWGESVAEAVRRGDISSMSFGFVVEKKGTHDSWSNDHTQRTLHEVKLLEVSPVTGWPAYAATTASVRSLIGAIDWSDAESAERVLDGLTEDQRALLLRVLNRRAPKPFIAPDVAAAQRRLEALMALHKPRP